MTIETLKKTFTGEVILPQDADYEQASSTLFSKGTPALVARVKTPQDIAQVVDYAKENKLVISVRAGGHSGAGLSTNNGGVVIDLAHLNEVKITDTATNRVRVGAGAQWGNVAKALHEHGLGISSGDTRTVGVGGLTLGAGIGWMVREYGLAIDNMVSADIVTADGQLVTADAKNNSDLFWAVRGGGGNFGVATAFEFTAHKVGDVHFGPIVLAAENVPEILKGWRDYMRTAPEKLTTMAILFPANAMGGQAPASCILQCCWDGDDTDEANAMLEPLRKLGKVVNDGVTKKPYYQVLEDAHVPGQSRVEVGNAFFKEFSDDVITKVAAAHANGGLFQLRSVGGAMDRVAADATAFAHRDAEVLAIMPHFFPADVTDSQIQEGMKVWDDIAATADGAYINFFTRTAGEAEIKLAYPPATYERLATIKAKYDPQNVFNQNFNIKPRL